MKVLLVEDFEELRALLSTFMRRRGHEVSDAASPAEALEQAATINADVAILDYRLPDMDGVELGRQIQQRSPQTRIIICSASANTSWCGRDDIIGRVYGIEQ